MTFWNVINEGLLHWTGMGLLHASILALLAWLLSATLLRRCPPALLAALWTVVLVKFLLPPFLPGDFSLSSWLTAALGESGLLGPDALSLQASAAQMGSGTATALPTGTLAESLISFLGLATGLLKSAFLPLYLLLAGWLSARQLARSIRLWQSVGRLPKAGEQMERRVGELAARIGLRRSPLVLTTHEPVSPFVIGLWRPRLILPAETLKQLDPQSVQALIVHELAHLRRRDHWIRSIQNAVRLLLFFWPPVWWVCRRIDRFAEMACDQWAVTVSRINPQLYAESLLEVARRVGNASANQQKLAFAQRGRLMEERFEMILNRRNLTSPKLSWISLLLLAAWATFAWAGGAQPQDQEQSEEKKHIRIHRAGKEHPTKVKVFFSPKLNAQTILQEHPEADLDGDGELSGEETKAFKLQLHERKMEEFLAQHPEADLDGDGDFSMQEKAEFHRVRSMERMEWVLEHHSEADLDGDGSLSESELKALKQGNGFYFSPHSDDAETDGSSYEVVVDYVFKTGDEGDVKAKKLKGSKVLQLHLEAYEDGYRLTPSSDGEATYELIGEELKFISEHPIEVHQESGETRIFKLKGKTIEFKDGDFSMENILLHENEAPVTSQERRRRLLKTNPEADLNGDGEITAEEARSFAAKLQSSAKKKKKQ